MRTTTITCDDRAGWRAVVTVGPDGIVGDRLDERYLIEERIGAGGMGIVYAARDLDLDRRVAIKLVRPRAGDGAGRARLVLEARTMARLRHANVATVFDIGTVDERIFIVMELVDGGTLASWLRDKPRRWREITEVFLQAATGLAAAHAAGFVHRDFKPENVLVGRDGVVRVTDFGLARMIDDSNSGVSNERQVARGSVTASAPVSGTPGYIAPEVLRRETFDARADQFSICVALHVALFGRRPFSDDGGSGRAPVDGGRSASADRVPRWLTRMILRGLATEPTLRWPSLAAMIAAIERRLRRQRRPAHVAAAVAAVTLVTSLIVLRETRTPAGQLCRGAQTRLAGVWDDARKRTVHAAFAAMGKPYAEAVFTELARSLDDGAARWVAMRTDACEATQVRGEQSQEVLDLRMECLDQWRAELDADVALLASTDPAIALRVPQMTAALSSSLPRCADIPGLRAPVRPPADPALHARVRDVRERLAKVRALQFAAKPKEGIALAVPLAAEARALSYRPLEAEALYQLGLMQRLSGDAAAAHQSLLDAIYAARAGRDARFEVLIAAALATWSVQAKIDEGHDWVTRGLAAVEAMATRDPEAEAVLYTSAAEVSLMAGKGEVALDYDRRALLLRAKIEPADSVSLAAAHVNLGRELADLSRHSEATAELRRGLTTFEARLGPAHPKVAWATFLLATVLDDQGDNDQAIVAYRSSIAIYEAAMGLESTELSLPLSNLGHALMVQARYDEALACLRRSLAITSKTRGPDHPHVGFAIMSIADVLLAEGNRLREAEQEAQRALAQFQRTLPAGHHLISQSMTVLGHIELELRQPARALALLEQASGMASIHPEERPEVQFLLARALWDTRRDRPRARQLAEQARAGYVGLGHGREKAIAEVEAWLAQHR